MNIIALTGGIGSGKSAACEVFKTLGIPVVDLDDISHQLTAESGAAMPAITSIFGQAYVNEHGALNRDLMRETVFNQPEARQQLNDIMHPAIYQAASEAFKLHADKDYQVLAIPLLDQGSQYHQDINHVLVIDCDEEVQIARVMQRSALRREEVAQIMAAQLTRDERLALADTVIENNGSLACLKQNVVDFHQNYINTCIVGK